MIQIQTQALGGEPSGGDIRGIHRRKWIGNNGIDTFAFKFLGCSFLQDICSGPSSEAV